MSEKKKLFEAYIEDNKIKIDIVSLNKKGFPFLQYALKLLEIELTRQIIETEYPEQQIQVATNEDIISRIKQ
jgi:hypothetical protein